MGIRDYLADYVEPYDTAAGFKPGDKVIAATYGKYGDFEVPIGSELVIDCVPEARHGGDLYALGSVNWTDPETGETHEGLEWALSAETADHHYGEPVAGVHRPGEEPARLPEPEPEPEPEPNKCHPTTRAMLEAISKTSDNNEYGPADCWNAMGPAIFAWRSAGKPDL